MVIEKPSGKNISCLKGKNSDGLICLYYSQTLKLEGSSVKLLKYKTKMSIFSGKKQPRARVGDSTFYCSTMLVAKLKNRSLKNYSQMP